MFKYEDIVLQDSDLDSLLDQNQLTDQVISFYFAYLSSSYESSEILLVAPSTSLWLANCNDDKTVSNFAESCKLSTKKLALFAVSDCEDFESRDGGSNWSTLVYNRSMNVFVHFETSKGVNNISAKKLYDSVKNYMGPGGAQVSKSGPLKKKRDKKKSVQLPVSIEPAGGLPEFVEWDKTEQSNGVDCGLYVLSIAKVICHWFLYEIDNIDMLSVIVKRVDHKVELVLDIIQELGKG